MLICCGRSTRGPKCTTGREIRTVICIFVAVKSGEYKILFGVGVPKAPRICVDGIDYSAMSNVSISETWSILIVEVEFVRTLFVHSPEARALGTQGGASENPRRCRWGVLLWPLRPKRRMHSIDDGNKTGGTAWGGKWSLADASDWYGGMAGVVQMRFVPSASPRRATESLGREAENREWGDQKRLELYQFCIILRHGRSCRKTDENPTRIWAYVGQANPF